MANIKSAIKRVKIAEKQTLRNRAAKSEMKTTIRRFDEALKAGDAAASEKAYLTAVSNVDHAAAKGMIHKNAANRKKAQLAKKTRSRAVTPRSVFFFGRIWLMRPFFLLSSVKVSTMRVEIRYMIVYKIRKGAIFKWTHMNPG